MKTLKTYRIEVMWRNDDITVLIISGCPEEHAHEYVRQLISKENSDNTKRYRKIMLTVEDD